jgi:hypothetical protein
MSTPLTPVQLTERRQAPRPKRVSPAEQSLLAYLLALPGWIEWEVLEREAAVSGVSATKARDLIAKDDRFEAGLGPKGARWRKR